MMRVTWRSLAVLVVLAAWLAGPAVAADLKPIKIQKTKDVNVRLLSESGQWKPGKNSFVLEFTSVKDSKPSDVGKVSLNTAMPMPGMAPMLAGATLEPDGSGRYRGTISFPDSGDRQVTVAWDGPAGKGSTKFTVPVR
ncbi:MAG TPA: FixH family protein [Methylomirabilota bacterium]|nr:FixH family protein [Methylomirabilota bacterium]